MRRQSRRMDRRSHHHRKSGYQISNNAGYCFGSSAGSAVVLAVCHGYGFGGSAVTMVLVTLTPWI